MSHRVLLKCCTAALVAGSSLHGCDLRLVSPAPKIYEKFSAVLPPVAVLKPVHGNESRLREIIFQQPSNADPDQRYPILIPVPIL